MSAPSPRNRGRSRGRRPIVSGVGPVALLTLALGCSGPTVDSGSPGNRPAGLPAADTTVPVEYPAARWATAEPRTLGLDPAPLEGITGPLEGTATDCVVVVKKGKVVYEHTWNGFDPDKDQFAWSISKSVTSLLVGMALDEGKLRMDQPVAELVPEWQGTPSEAVTIRNLLSMDSGRFSDFQTEFVALQTTGAADQTAFSIGLSQQHPPGTVWAYSNTAVQVLERVLSLALNQGRWQDRQLVPASWIQASTKPSQQLRRDYGYLWWLNTPVPDIPYDPDLSGPGKEVAANAFLGLGLFGQYVTVIPDDSTVVVRTGRADQGADRFPDTKLILDLILRQVSTAEKAVRG
jgi:CubicO group peptidase (beta-lactamase class C family)